MKTIIQKRADQLQPGDIICHRGGGRSVVQHTINDGVTVKVHTATIGSIADSTKHWATHTTFDVEVAQLTPAQQHADEMVKLLRDIRTLPAGARVDLARRADELLAKITQPPTMNEVLESMCLLVQAASGYERNEDVVTASKLLARARAAGMIK
jgi:hypothetical protein